jgi:hypothetical protein
MASNSAALPIPIGVTASFSNVPANTATAQFWMDQGQAVITWRPRNTNDNGLQLTLTDQNSNVILTMTQPGQYYYWQVPIGGLKYTFKSTMTIDLVAATSPNILR